MPAQAAVLILTAQESAVFSERAATEGEHRTLAHPPGSALLGWAARHYDGFPGNQFKIFHGGGVRFSNALPLTATGRVAWPMPQLLAQPKHLAGGIAKDPEDPTISRLDFDSGRLRVGRLKDDPTTQDEQPTQYEALAKSLFVAADGELVAPELGSRLRTATRDGRASDGALFGYQHIRAAGAPRYAATVEADDLNSDLWEKLLGLFDGQTLYLGRAAGTANGGAYSCEIQADVLASDVWPVGAVPAETRRLRVWALSDLALTDHNGGPSFVITPEMLGLPKPWRLDGADSAIGVRRYAPWNGKLRRRDLERQVISAGSVISFECLAGEPPAVSPPAVIGGFREAGLGRIWVAPPLLAGDPGDPPTRSEQHRLARPVSIVPPTEPADDPLVAWLKASREVETAR